MKFLSQAKFTEERFAKIFAAGGLNIDGGEAVQYWLGQDGQFYVRHYFRATYQYCTNPMGWKL